MDKKTINVQKQEQTNQSQHAFKLLQVANYLSLKAITAKKKQSLIFQILNDTVHMIRYDRALLWDMTKPAPKLLGISGESKINMSAPLVKKWKEAVQGIKEPTKAQVLTFTSQNEQENTKKENIATMLWLPIYAHEKLALGLWLELWNIQKDKTPPQEMVNLLMNFLIPSYGVAWEKFNKKFTLKQSKLSYASFYALVAACLVASAFVRIPLRVVAPCEVVPEKPVLVTAPLEGIIEEIKIKPGTSVTEGSILFEYDKRVPLQELQVAKKEVEILQSEIKRASTLGIEDPKARTELSILTLKLEREKANLEFAEYQASKLTVTAPEAGVVMLDNPDEWRGKPVLIGEKVLGIANPAQSKVRIWIPESDNIGLDFELPIKVFLNVSPETSRMVKLTYIANESSFNDKQVPSFVAEAAWESPPNDIKLGLKGTAILFGDDVSFFYFIFRKPWRFLRNTLGI